jgi:hypothetical protein
MQTKQSTMLQSLRNVEAFLEEHADKLAGVVSTGARQQLADTIAALADEAKVQAGSKLTSKAATKKELDLRHALLHDHMEPIARIAKAKLPHTADFSQLKVPTGKPTAQKLTADAYAMAEKAQPHADVFIASGLPKEFSSNLTAAANAMMAAIDEKSTSRGNRRGATTGIKARLTAGRQTVHILDSFVKTALKDDPALLANWKISKRVRKSNTSAASAPAATPPVPAPTPAPAAPTTATAPVASTTSTPAAHTAPA